MNDHASDDRNQPALEQERVNGLALFAGAGMLDEGLRAGFAHMGIETRIVCYVEREMYAGGILAARMEEGSLDGAPVWPDVTTFDGRRFRGCVDFIVAGFPCQDISVAGRRAGLDGSRSGLFYEILRVADDSGARILFLENVAGIASATATVVDEEEGELLERAAARVVGELADRGWDAEWITLSASDVGASHGRERWFCLAWRTLADAARHAGDRSGKRENGRGRGVCEAGDELGHTECARRTPSGSGYEINAGRESESGCGAVADTECPEQRPHAAGGIRDEQGFDAERQEASRARNGDEILADTDHGNRSGLRSGEQPQKPVAVCGCAQCVADASGTRRKGRELRGTRDIDRGGAGSTWINSPTS